MFFLVEKELNEGHIIALVTQLHQIYVNLKTKSY
jgi:hypothetical protein